MQAFGSARPAIAGRLICFDSAPQTTDTPTIRHSTIVPEPRCSVIRTAVGSLSQGVTLFGRHEEISRLRAAIDDPYVAGVILRGPAGSGKTALAAAALAEAAVLGAFTGSGKYAEVANPAPFGPPMRALSQAVGAALDRLDDPEPVAEAMREALGPAVAVLSAVGFEASVTPSAGPSVLFGRRENASRVLDAALKLTRWLARFDCPIVLFVDDWRRGADVARDLVALLIGEATALRMTLILAERDDRPADPLADDPSVSTIEVGKLDTEARIALLDAALGGEGGGDMGGAALVEWLGDNGPALAFDILSAAQAVKKSSVLVRGGGRWRVDSAGAARLDRRDIAMSLVDRMRTLGEDARNVALAAGLWGDRAPLLGLACAVGLPQIRFEAALRTLESAGILLRRESEVSFLHDRIRAAVLDAPDRDVAEFAGKLADRLAASPPADWPVVAAAALRFRQIGGLEGAPTVFWRDRFAAEAAQARARLDFDAASGFAESAWWLRTRDGPGDAGLDRAILREAVLAAPDLKDPGEVMGRVRRFVTSSDQEEAMGEAYALGVTALRLVGDADGAWSMAREGMARFGVSLPARTGKGALLAAAARWKLERRLRSRDSAPIVTFRTDAFTKLANVAANLAWERSPYMAALIALSSSRRASREAKPSAFWMATDTFLCAFTGDYTEAARLGDLAADVAERPEYDGFARAATLYRATYWGSIWRRPQASLRDRCLEIRDLALAEGDLVQAALAIRNWIMIGWRTSASLFELEPQILEAEREVRRLGDADTAMGIAAVKDAVNGLLGRRGSGDELALKSATPSPPNELLVALEVASCRGDWAAGAELAARNQALGRTYDSHSGGVALRFHASLARLKIGRRAHAADLAFIRRAAKLNPTDHRGKLLLLRAEMLRVRPGRAACLAAFAEAVAVTDAGTSRLEAGLAAECAADAARGAGDFPLAERYHRRAQAVWEAWGATAKLDSSPGSGLAIDDLSSRLIDAQAQTVAAERTDRAKSRYLADVAHELRTPMQAMQGLLDLAASDPGAADLAAMSDVFGSLKNVVDDLTDYGAFASGEAPLVMGPAAIVDLLRSECAVAQAFAAQRGATLSLEVADDVPALVETDGSRVRQVVRNLLSNAAKYGDDGPIIVRLTIDAPEGGAAARLSIRVEDTGPGLTDAELLHLFQPFERGAHAGDGRGLGLGLALSRRIAQRLGGGLSADNRPGGGARFVFQFPLKPAVALEELGQTRPLRILLAEDVDAIRQVIGAVLRRQHHDVVEVANGVAAREQLGMGGFDLAIIDLVMPGLGGLELLGCLRSLPRPLADLPVILLTATSDAAALAEAKRAGASMVLRKPVSAQDLRRALAALFAPAPGEEIEADATFEVQMRGLAAAARAELEARIPEFLTTVERGEATIADAHRIAGLAAQFGWATVAQAADELEESLRSASSTQGAASRLALALEAMK
jgi:signal transduction histidine kinase/DNA-binding response OmpR family regulator